MKKHSLKDWMIAFKNRHEDELPGKSKQNSSDQVWHKEHSSCQVGTFDLVGHQHCQSEAHGINADHRAECKYKGEQKRIPESAIAQ